MKPRIVNDLRPLTMADYDDAIARYVEHCERMPGVRAFYRFGSIGAPGISDVDLIVVLDDEIGNSEAQPGLSELRVWHSRWQEDELFRYCFMHDAMVWTASMFRSLPWHMVGSELVLLAGSAMNVEPLSEDAARMVRLVQGLDFCIARLHEMARLEEQSGISMRLLLPLLWSVTHTRALLESEGTTLQGQWHSVILQLRELRSVPVRTISAIHLEQLIRPTRELFEHAAGCFIERLIDLGALPAGGIERECAVASREFGQLTVYRAGRTEQGRTSVAAELISRSVSVFGRKVVASWTRVALPSAALLHHLAYLTRREEHAALASQLAQQAGGLAAERGPRSTSPVYRDVIDHRARLDLQSARLRRVTGVQLHGPGVPGLPVGGVVSPGRTAGSLRYRALRALLDRDVLPAGTIMSGVEPV